MAQRSRKYGGKFGRGFGQFLEQPDLADVTIIGPSGEARQAHMLLLSYHSEFFRRAFTSDFKEGQKGERTLKLGFEDPAGVWPTMLEFMYTDEVTLTDGTVLPLLAMSRELMVKSIEDFCSDYAQSSLEPSNAISYLNQAVQFNCESFRESCVALVAEGFPSSFNKPTDGLPSEVVMEVLTHPHLVVQTEEQVLTFVLNYVQRHDLSPETVRQLYGQVRFPYLSNEQLSSLANEDSVPKDLLLAGMSVRFQLIDHPERLAALLTHFGMVPGSAGSVTGLSGPLTYPSANPGLQAAGGSSRTDRSSNNNANASARQGLWWSSAAQQALPPLPVAPSWAGSGHASSAGTPGSATPVPGGEHTGDANAPSPAQSAANALAAAGIPMPAVPATFATPAAPAGPRPSIPGSTPLPLPATPGGAASTASVAPVASAALAASPLLAGILGAAPPHTCLPRKTYICSIEYGLPGGSEYACVPLHEVWDELVPQLHVRVSGDVVEGDAQSILRSHDNDSSWFMVSGEAGSQQPVWIEIELPPNMRVVELNKFTFSHGMNFANHMFPYGISDSAWFQMKCLYTQVSEGGADSEPFYTLRTSESSASNAQFEYSVGVDSSGPRVPPWRRLRISTSEEQSSGTVRLSVRKLRLFGRVEVSLTREGPPGGKDVLALWRRRKDAPNPRQLTANRASKLSTLGAPHTASQ